MPMLAESWASTDSPGSRSTETPWSEPTLMLLLCDPPTPMLSPKLQLVDPPTLPRPANSTEYSTVWVKSTLVVMFQFVSNVLVMLSLTLALKFPGFFELFRRMVVLMIDGWEVSSRICALLATITVCTCGQW